MTTRPFQTPPATAIDTVIFDLGGVVVQWEPHRAYPELTIEQFAEIAERIGFGALNLRADAGERWADLEAETAERWPELSGFVARYPRNFAATLAGEVPGMTAVLTALRAAGMRCYGLTNWSAETYPMGAASTPAVGLLHGVVVSGDEGVVKPDPALYRVLLERFEVEPSRAVFVDDRGENVAAAHALGMAGVVFRSAEDLVVRLRELGVDLPDH